jgi:hypothetical protein
MTRQLTREQLFELVWSSPVSKVASTLGLSDVGLAKRCKREGIPLPPRGYWAKHAAGHAPSRPSLPPKPEPQPAVHRPAKAPKSPMSTKVPAPELTKRVFTRRRRVNRLPKGDRLETFWCKLDRWERSYSFGVNWDIWEFNEKSWSEHDYLELFTTIRSKNQRPYQYLRVSLWPVYISRDEINAELTGIGGVWTDRSQKGWLRCGAFTPYDAYHSLCGAVGRNEFKEVVVQIRNFKRGQGTTSELSLRPELTDLSGDE